MLVFKQKIVPLYPQSLFDMVKRKADELIRNFILNDRRSLLVTGARQVGKTFSIRKVGKECFDNVVEINFVEQPDAIKICFCDCLPSLKNHWFPGEHWFSSMKYRSARR